MTEHDPKVSSRYRELRAEEPPRALDDAILAAAHRAVRTRPAPLVVPTGRRRWYFPLAAAAVLVLAVAVTVHVQREQPAEELVTAARVPPPPTVAATSPQGAQEAKQPERAVPAAPPQFTPDPKPQAAPEPPPAMADSRARRSAAAPVEERAAAAPPASAAADQLMMRRVDPQRDAVAGSRESARAEASAPAPQAAPAPAARAMAALKADALSNLARVSPEQWLLGIDDLKRQGKHEEAERELAEFRKRYPNYRIPEAITEKFERR